MRKKVEIVHPVHIRYQVTGLQVRFGEGFFGIGRFGTCWPIVRTSAMDVSVESVEIAQLALLDKVSANVDGFRGFFGKVGER